MLRGVGVPAMTVLSPNIMGMAATKPKAAAVRPKVARIKDVLSFCISSIARPVLPIEIGLSLLVTFLSFLCKYG